MMGRKLWVIGLCLVVAVQVSFAAEGGKKWEFSATLMGLYDDNRDSAENNKEAMLETHAGAKAALNAILNRTEFEFSYAPSLRFRDNPRYNQNDSDVYHDLALTIDHDLSPRSRLYFNEFFRVTDDPAVMEGDWTFRESVSYQMNRIGLGMNYDVMPDRGVLSLRANHLMKSYTEDDDYSQVGDENSLSLAATMKYLTRSRYNVLFDLSYRDTSIDTEYSDASGSIDRGSQVIFVGAGVERIFGFWRARIRGGLDMASYDNATKDGATEPGIDLEVSYAPSDLTSVDLAVQLHTLRGDVSPYAVQERTSIRLTAKRALSQRTKISLTGVYGIGSYSANSVALDSRGSVVDASKIDGDDGLLGISFGMSFRMRENVALVAGLGYQDWDSDAWLRESHTRFTGKFGVSTDF